ncbi:Uncharacterized protein OBRU01_05000 [Operophtera brumata]|uniref:Uncharacterized protein n=1 Tax=Operophtera brumata TaxID=104452 RepID=A0A0L7LN65_OPEBR|nr:Uncharacterized protein OBRU01_05000 [Operophtera brumata]
MRRSLCALAALNHGVQTGKMKLTNFKDWKFRDPPSYAALPIDENPEYNVPTEGLTGTLHLVCASEDALIDILDLDPSVAESKEFIDFVAGKYLPPGGLSVSHR